QTRADPAAFFAADQHVLLQHQFADVFEADRNFMKLPPKLRRQLVDQFRYRKCLCNIARQLSRPREVPDQQSKNLVRIDECARPVNGPDALAVAVRAKPYVVLAVSNRLAKRLNMRLNRLRIVPTKPRIARSANFAARNTVPPKQFGQQSRRGSVHRVK